MDRMEAQLLLDDELDKYAAEPWERLRSRVGAAPLVSAVSGATGSKYQVEVEFVWDDPPDQALRILGAIGDGGLTAWFPLSADRLVRPPGK